MSTIGERLTESEIAALDQPVPEGVVAVWGEDWDGNPVLRGIRAGQVTCLRGEFGKKFDIRGPEATLCGECGELLLVDAAGKLTLLHQQHLYREHGISAAILP